jgi:hypothetical protein
VLGVLVGCREGSAASVTDGDALRWDQGDLRSTTVSVLSQLCELVESNHMLTRPSSFPEPPRRLHFPASLAFK